MKETGLIVYAPTPSVINLPSLGGTRVLQPEEQGVHIADATSGERLPAPDASPRLLRSPSRSLANRGERRAPEVQGRTTIAARFHGRGGLAAPSLIAASDSL